MELTYRLTDAKLKKRVEADVLEKENRIWKNKMIYKRRKMEWE